MLQVAVALELAHERPCADPVRTAGAQHQRLADLAVAAQERRDADHAFAAREHEARRVPVLQDVALGNDPRSDEIQVLLGVAGAVDHPAPRQRNGLQMRQQARVGLGRQSREKMVPGSGYRVRLRPPFRPGRETLCCKREVRLSFRRVSFQHLIPLVEKTVCVAFLTRIYQPDSGAD